MGAKKNNGATAGMWSIVNTYILLYWFPYEYQRQPGVMATMWAKIKPIEQQLEIANNHWSSDKNKYQAKANMAQPPDFGYDQLKKMIRARDFRIANLQSKKW